MVNVIKKGKKAESFKPGKIENSCKKAGVADSIAKAIAGIVSKKAKGKKSVPSSWIKAQVFAIFDSIAKAKKHWIAYKKK